MWAAVETAEKTKDGRLARQLIVALPIELERDDWLLLLRGFIQMECVDKGMCADFAIHDPDGHNPHAHIMVTMRPLDAHGKWQSKTQKEYLCRKADEERGFTAQEFLQAKEDGWEKQYKYRSAAGVSAWLTPTQAARELGWERCSKQPKAAKFGRQNPLCARWNSPEQLLDWREAWADAVNRALEEKQQSARETHLSHAALGLDEQPTVHEGSQARSLELQGIKADRCELNRQIRADNKLLRELKAQLAKLSKVVENTVALCSSFLPPQNSTLELRIRFSRRMLMLFINSVLPCGQSSPSNENRRYTAKAVLMIRQSRLRKKSWIQKSRMFTAPLNSRTFPKAITKNSDKRPAAAFFAKAAAVVRMSILRIFRRNCRRNRRCRYSTRWNCCRP